MSKKAESAIGSYVKSAYMRINLRLRNGTPMGDADAGLVQRMDEELETLPRTDALIVYRNGGPLTGYTVADLQAGKTFKDKAYFSTSTDGGYFGRVANKTGIVFFTIR